MDGEEDSARVRDAKHHWTLKRAVWYSYTDKSPVAGDAVYGKVVRLGNHSTLENRSGRMHMLNDGTRAIFVFGNRYAPDHYEGFVPSAPATEVDMLAKSGVVGEVRAKNSSLKDPTRVRVLGYVCKEDGTPISTLDNPLISPRRTDKGNRRSKLILVVGTSMNSGKSMAAAACCSALLVDGTRGPGVEDNRHSIPQGHPPDERLRRGSIQRLHLLRPPIHVPAAGGGAASGVQPDRPCVRQQPEELLGGGVRGRNFAAGDGDPSGGAGCSEPDTQAGVLRGMLSGASAERVFCGIGSRWSRMRSPA